MPARPAAIMVVAMFLFLATVIASVVGISMLLPNPLLDRLWALNQPGAVFVHSTGPNVGLAFLALACGTFAAAFGLLHGRRWAWWFAVILFQWMPPEKSPAIS